MKLMSIDAVDEQTAHIKLAQQLGVGLADLKFVRAQEKKFSFEVLTCPAKIDVDVSSDGMRATIRKISLPIGENAPRLDVNFVVGELNKSGVKMGIRRDVISAELLRIFKTPGWDENTVLAITVAEGVPAVAGSSGRPKWLIDLKLFEKNIPLYARAGEVLAKAAHATAPKDGFKVSGETIKARIDEQFKLNVGAGIKVVKETNEVLYVAQTFGKLHFDQGIRLRLESKVADLEEGMVAAVETMKQTITGLPVRGVDLLEMSKEQRVTFGFLSPEEVDAQLRSEKKWPALIRVAKGRLPVDGSHGRVILKFKEAKSSQSVDVQRIKAGIVFPGEEIAVLEPPKEPIPGETVFGEHLRGRPCDDFPIYPGRNVVREKVGTNILFKSAIYGRVKQDKDRIGVENILSVSADKMEVTLDFFPQIQLTAQDMINLLREADILLQPDKDDLDRRLKESFGKALRIEKFIVMRGQSPTEGADAKLIYRFNPEIFKEKGLFQKKAELLVFAMPGDLLLTKIQPHDAQDGVNVFRERIPVPASSRPKDIEIKSGKGVDEKEIGKEGDSKDPLRIEYRAAVIGVVSWKDRHLDVKSTLRFDGEKSVSVDLAPLSDFGTRVTEELLRGIAEKEGIKVALNASEIQQALSAKRNPDGSLTSVVLARAEEPKHGTHAVLQYFVDYNEKSVDHFLGQRKLDPGPPTFTDCIRPKEILGVKKPATRGEDGRSIFGRRIPADPGRDEQWYFGSGVEKSPDGLQIFCSLEGPGFAFLDDGRLVVRSTVKIASDKMSALVSIYPTKNPRFPLREDKILSMLTAAGVKSGVHRYLIKETIDQVIQTGAPVMDLVVAEGVKPTRGQEGSFVLAVDVGTTVGEIRSDGSVDFKERHIFLSVRKGQLLLIKRPPGHGEEGRNVCDEKIPSIHGSDAKMEAVGGVDLANNGLEYRAAIDGILEIKNRSIKVIGGLLIPDDVSFKTGHIDAGFADLFIKGGVLADFHVRSGGTINIEKAVEAASVMGGSHVRIKGGVIGRGRGLVRCEKNMETIYISGGATVEVLGDLNVGTEILNSQVRVGGTLTCVEGAGTICGGEVWAYNGMKVKTIGAPGSEVQTIIHLGEHFFKQKAAEEQIKNEGLDPQIHDLEEKIRALLKEIAGGMDKTGTVVLQGQELQERYRVLVQEKQELERQADHLKQMRQNILDAVPRNSAAVLVATDMIYPGVTIMHKSVIWVLKEPQRAVEIRWNAPTSNLVSRRV